MTGQYPMEKEMGIDMDDIQHRKVCVNLTDKDIGLIREMEGLVQNHADRIVENFYGHLLSFEETRTLLKDQAIVERLLQVQKKYLLDIFKGQYDEAYCEGRLRIGAVHHRIGLAPKWYIGTYALYENLLSPLIAETYGTESDRGLARIMALRKVFLLDMALVLDFYSHRMTAQLEEKIREMDDFTHVVSHDLKEPLRGIEAFSGFLLEDYGERLDQEGHRYLSLIKKSAVRMKDLIQDLLTLTAISRKGQAFQEVDLNRILIQVQQELAYSINEKSADIRLSSPFPVVHCNPIQIAEVFKNLLSNAIKFNTATPPKVEIAVKEEERFYIFSVKDNGIGIDARYTKQIFHIFERLHPQEAFEGTGAGLAICRKVIEGYGGRIWVESQLGEGTTFFLTLPKNPGSGMEGTIDSGY